ncbi:putative toxin-antitoxin system toxin component, PIN family [Thermomonas sp.]|uniref:putative toxin-antitoxin system toxin component, PIN family n=1 Tax=Thermomonas sp. TaxID=1971895 RepID=UPI002486D976|nr:putative toxin-antitoxin system toxin component, PIN family [Thermomonas sp.]MDI1251819.1 putative toxin-antitoxin system toxin component, PIN family [Thermomonas sp.]
MKHPPRVVLDTNVVVSALLFRGGVSGQLRLAWQRGAFEPLVSNDTVQELIRVLAYPKFKLPADAQHELLADYLPHTRVIRIAKPPVVPACRDPFDMPFLYLAATGRADVLVSGDADLLALAEQVRFSILAPANFLAVLYPAGSSV